MPMISSLSAGPGRRQAAPCGDSDPRAAPRAGYVWAPVPVRDSARGPSPARTAEQRHPSSIRTLSDWTRRSTGLAESRVARRAQISVPCCDRPWLGYAGPETRDGRPWRDVRARNSPVIRVEANPDSGRWPAKGAAFGRPQAAAAARDSGGRTARASRGRAPPAAARACAAFESGRPAAGRGHAPSYAPGAWHRAISEWIRPHVVPLPRGIGVVKQCAWDTASLQRSLHTVPAAA
jgi:hypothetical protein